ncbi:MAG: pyruvate dehydrogenase complex dihydrolipoamide acetyltransferase [Rhodospirillales bacterium]
MPIQILMPALSPTMTEGTLAKWLKKEGDAVDSGDVIAEIETDKATMELEVIDEGVLGRILVPEGTTGVQVNQTVALLLEEGEDASALDAAAAAPPPAPPPQEAPAPAPAPSAAPPEAPRPAPSAPPATPPPQAAPPGRRVFASPLARRLAGEAGLDLAAVPGTGPHGRIVKSDIEAAVAGGVAVPAAAPVTPVTAVTAEQTYTAIPNTTMRKVIAARLSQSKRDIPHFYLTIDCRMDALLDVRRELNANAPEGEGSYKLSVNDFIIRAVALALRRVPAANATWTDEAILRYDRVDVCVAVATPGGLITPVIRGADNKGLRVLSSEMNDLAARAREGKLLPEEYQGGGFTISNLGMYGIKEFAAIINPPQSCILAVGAGAQRPVVEDGALAVATVMSCTLAVDHRAVDGAVGAEFLGAFKRLIEAPLTMLL